MNYEIQTEIQMYLHWQRLKTKKQQQKKKMYQGCSEGEKWHSHSLWVDLN